jgi:hypothetical protein
MFMAGPSFVLCWRALPAVKHRAGGGEKRILQNHFAKLQSHFGLFGQWIAKSAAVQVRWALVRAGCIWRICKAG